MNNTESLFGILVISAAIDSVATLGGVLPRRYFDSMISSSSERSARYDEIPNFNTGYSRVKLLPAAVRSALTHTR